MMLHPPGNVAEASQEWSKTVQGLFAKALHGDQQEGITGALEGAEPAGQPPSLYDPVEEPLEADEVLVPPWPALSGTLRALSHLSEEQRWQIADRSRTTPATTASGEALTGPDGRPLFGQDEYCEWSVERNDSGDIVRVTFTTELGEWFRHLAKTDPEGLISLYQGLAGEPVDRSEIVSEDGSYVGCNAGINSRTDGPIVHLAQGNNNLWAAISLAAEASVLRTRGGAVVTDQKVLMRCAGLGAAERFSDPSIASTVNTEVSKGARVSLADPIGLYLAGIRTEGMRLPPGHEELAPQDLWVPERGKSGRVVRARFEAPNGAFPISEILLNGKPIVTGAQLAERVDVFIMALVHAGDAEPMKKPCD